MCPDWGLNLQPWPVGTELQTTELPGQGGAVWCEFCLRDAGPLVAGQGCGQRQVGLWGWGGPSLCCHFRHRSPASQDAVRSECLKGEFPFIYRNPLRPQQCRLL